MAKLLKRTSSFSGSHDQGGSEGAETKGAEAQDAKARGANPRKIIALAVPVGLESVFQMGFNFVDQIIVGYLGAEAVASVGLSNSVASIALLLYASAGVGAGVLVARAVGSEDRQEVSRVASVGQTMAGLLGLLTAVGLSFFSEQILRLVGADSNLVQTAKIYFQLYAASTFPMIISSVTSAVFRSLDDARTPMVVTSLAVALNTALGFMLVLGLGPVPKLGVAGAGLATLISQSSRALALVVLLYLWKREVKWYWPFPSKTVNATAGRLLKLTGPIAMSEVLWGTSSFIYAVVFTRLGTSALAASQIVLSLESILVVAASGLGPAAVTVVGQALGAGSLRGAKASSWITLRFGIVASVVLGGLMVLTNFLLHLIYPKVGPDVLHLAFGGVLLMAFIQPAKVLSSVLGNGILASGGDTRFVLLGNLAGTYMLGLPVAAFLASVLKFGFFGVFAAKILEEITKATWFFVRFRSSRWYTNALKESNGADGEGQGPEGG